MLKLYRHVFSMDRFVLARWVSVGVAVVTASEIVAAEALNTEEHARFQAITGTAVAGR